MYPREYFDTYWRGDLKDEVFVAMPFDKEFTPVREKAIQPAIEKGMNQPLRAHLVDATTISNCVLTEILCGIANARIIFADISVCRKGKWKGQRNGNVMYEVGLAHAIRQAEEVILVRSDDEEINFDVANIRIHKYDSKDLGAARKRFVQLLNEAVEHINQVKRLKVEDAYGRIDRDSYGLMTRYGRRDGFSIPKEEQDDVSTKIAVQHLLALGTIHFDLTTDESSTKYAYLWTEFGKAVLKRITL